MSKHSRFVFSSGVLLTVFLLNLVCPAVVYAEDGTPPPVTEEPVQPSEQRGTEKLPLAPEVTESPATIEAVATKTPEVPAEQTSNLVEGEVENFFDKPDTVEATTVDDVLAALPENTEIAVLNDVGGLEPLATQEAAQIVQSGDPIWCPIGVTPQASVNGCTDPGPSNSNYDPTSLASLLTYLAANPPNQSGVIWIESSYDSSVNDPASTGFSLDGATIFSTMSQYSLTIQGGWSGGNNTNVNHNTPSLFMGDSLTIQNWNGNVTINDIEILSSAATGLTVETNGNITLFNVVSSDNAGNGASLDNCGFSFGTGGCTVSGSIDITASAFGETPTIPVSGNDLVGLVASSSGSITLANVTASGNSGNWGASLTSRSSSGVSIANSSFNDNQHVGLHTSSQGSITLSNVIANSNGATGTDLNNCFFEMSGNVCTGLGDVSVTDSNFNENLGPGLGVSSGSNITLAGVIANDNAHNGAYLNNCFYSGTECMNNVFVSNSNFDGNTSRGTDVGLLIYSGGNVVLNTVSASNSGAGSGTEMHGFSSLLVLDSTFNNNYSDDSFWGFGLYTITWNNADITLKNVTASGNHNGNGIDEAGAHLETGGNVVILCSQFSDNGGFGVDAENVDGMLMLTDVTFSGNTIGDYRYNGTPAITSDDCKVTVDSGGRTHVFGGVKHVYLPHIVLVNSGEQIELDCQLYSGTKLVLPNGDRVIFRCPTRDHGLLTAKTQAELPGMLDEKFGFVSALDAEVIRDGEALLTLDTSLTIDFFVPEDQKDVALAILRWDEEQSRWIEVPGGYQTGDDHFVAASNFTGTYVLITK